MVRVGTVVMNVKDARRASEFWRHVLGYDYRDGGYDGDATPVLVPQQGNAEEVAFSVGQHAAAVLGGYQGHGTLMVTS
jgi:catechol 2,3-dioxygenase-like lactoylglutathione lyase family enzyme